MNNKARANIAMWARVHYSVDLRIQTFTEPVPLKYGKLATKYLWIITVDIRIFLQCDIQMCDMRQMQSVSAV